MLLFNQIRRLSMRLAAEVEVRRLVSFLPILSLSSILAVPATLWPINRDAPDAFAYEPAAATPLGPYLMRDGLKGPVQVLALNAKGETTQTSRLKYDERGRLISESFFDSQNRPAGEIRYTFKDGLPVREDSYDQKGELVSSKIRSYQQGKLAGIVVTEHKVVKLQRSYSYSRDRISIRESVEKNADQFYILLDEKGRPTSMELLDQEKKPLQTIEYKYDAQGRLQERLRTMTDAVSRCQYEYDEQGRLSQYVYADKGPSDWKVSRTIRLVYASQI